MSTKFILYIEKYLYEPNLVQKIIAIILLPLSLLYLLLILVKFLYQSSKKINFGIKIISVGNLTLGGNGKTPLIKTIFEFVSQTHKTFIILRGYKRSSKGLYEACLDGKVLQNIKIVGDEAMEYSKTLKNANVIVCENRKQAIIHAKKLGAKVILLDDGFSKFDIDKFDILLKPTKEPLLPFVLPSSGWRYPKLFYKFCNFIPSKDDIQNTSYIQNKTQDMVLVTAIAQPQRLNKFISFCKGYEIFEDHHKFTKKELKNILIKYNATTILTTQKDAVKMDDFGLNISIIKLQTTISDNFKNKILNFIG